MRQLHAAKTLLMPNCKSTVSISQQQLQLQLCHERFQTMGRQCMWLAVCETDRRNAAGLHWMLVRTLRRAEHKQSVLAELRQVLRSEPCSLAHAGLGNDTFAGIKSMQNFAALLEAVGYGKRHCPSLPRSSTPAAGCR
jgi:hypothetical protein